MVSAVTCTLMDGLCLRRYTSAVCIKSQQYGVPPGRDKGRECLQRAAIFGFRRRRLLSLVNQSWKLERKYVTTELVLCSSWVVVLSIFHGNGRPTVDSPATDTM
jgi:hypothetical protein